MSQPQQDAQRPTSEEETQALTEPERDIVEEAEEQERTFDEVADERADQEP